MLIALLVVAALVYGTVALVAVSATAIAALWHLAQLVRPAGLREVER